MGAYLSNFAPFVATLCGCVMLTGCYDFPTAYVNVKGVFTNTQPVDAYRGAGRPEAAFVVERIVDAAARQLGIAGAELRRRNFIPPDAMPYDTALGLTYDSGDFAQNMDQAIELAPWILTVPDNLADRCDQLGPGLIGDKTVMFKELNNPPFGGCEAAKCVLR